MSPLNTYKGWAIIDKLPEGWRIDKNAGSPLTGHVFVTNGKSVLNGQKRALLTIAPAQKEFFFEPISQVAIEVQKLEKKPAQKVDPNTPRVVNEYARAKFKQKLLADILVDLTICEIEGWCKIEYINELKKLITSLGKNVYFQDNPHKFPHFNNPPL